MTVCDPQPALVLHAMTPLYKLTIVNVFRYRVMVTSNKRMAIMSVSLQPSRLLAEHLQVERQDGLTLFKFTDAAQARLELLLARRQDLGLTSDEQAEFDALAELDRIFTYINSQLALTNGNTSAQ